MVVAHTTVVIMVATSLWMILTMPLKSFSTASGKTTSETVGCFIILSLIYFEGAGVCERTDGFKYEGEWVNNRRHGYGVTTFKDGSKEEGKYKNNYFIPYKKKKLMVRSKKVREKIDNAVKAAKKAAETARQKAEIAISR